jgi:putative NADPH-quinone reductase
VRVLVIQAHPVADSFNAALLGAAVGALQTGGHEVRSHQLYAEGFTAAMTSEERHAYHGEQPILDPLVARHADDVRWAEALVFVYPTWWAGLPAVLKGWLERVLVPGVAFHLDERTNKVTPDLRHIRRIVGISTYGSPRAYVWLMNDAGRRTLLRSVRMLCARRTRTRWLGLYAMDRATADDRAAFVARIEQELRSL